MRRRFSEDETQRILNSRTTWNVFLDHCTELVAWSLLGAFFGGIAWCVVQVFT